ncbi:hypothetical protein Lalb_Chr12g0205851 [Lupinus albus]|uniref:Uncharacterized protein n=1 Tax=Lupinus albus TaxID=3870 RepID=A0A6A4PNE9_LUPAL|nr:hypothetical protein Lalb_Chr12g0205851 [Lupinus albus]
MDRIRISRKRKTSYSSRPHPLSGTLTRSKSQIFLHRNRSGHLHSDSRRRQQPYARSRRPRPRPAGCVSDTRHGSSENDDNNDYDDDVMVFIKDLRKKRKVKPKGEDSNCDGEDVSRVLIKDIRLRRVYSTQSSVEKDNSGDLKVKGESDEDFNVNVDDVTNTRIEESLINDSVLKSKSVLRPCVKEKLSKIPGAVSNKRLFPFLMDIMGDDFGTSKSGYCQKNEKGVNGGQDFQLSLSCRSQEGTKCELKDDKCTVLDTCHSGASEGDTLIGHVDELSHGNWSKLQSREVTSECLSVSSLNDICLSESKAGPTADFHGVRDVENSMHNDDFKQGSNHKRNLDRAKAANHGGYTSEQFGVLNEGCILTIPPDAVICNNPEVNLSQLESMPHDVHHVKPMGLARSTTENSGEVFYVTADKKKDPVRKSKSVPGPNLNRKFFKTPGSISYRRMLPFLKDLTKDDSVISEFCHPTLHKNDEVHMYAKKFEVPLSSQGCKASIEEHKTESGHMHGTVKCNALVNNVLVDPANELSHGNQLQLTPSPGILETPMQLDAKVVNGLSAPSPSEHIEKVEIGSKDVCLSDSKFDLCSLMVESECVKNVVNTEHNDGFEQVQNKIYRQHNSESTTPEAQNLLYINDVSSLAFENCSSKEKGLTIDCDEKKQFKGYGEA